jgi:hypothetical protein
MYLLHQERVHQAIAKQQQFLLDPLFQLSGVMLQCIEKLLDVVFSVWSVLY